MVVEGYEVEVWLEVIVCLRRVVQFDSRIV